MFRDFADAVLKASDSLRVSLGAWYTLDDRRAVWLSVSYSDAASGKTYFTAFSVTEPETSPGKAYAMVQHDWGGKPQKYICEAAAASGS